ncbi:MAG: hypothetical protein CL666_00385 [Balneola sp.]|nr:hypothetical protein [Balneola sp.]
MKWIGSLETKAIRVLLRRSNMFVKKRRKRKEEFSPGCLVGKTVYRKLANRSAMVTCLPKLRLLISPVKERGAEFFVGVVAVTRLRFRFASSCLGYQHNAPLEQL